MIKWVKDLIRKEMSDKYYTGPPGPIGPKGDKGDSFTDEFARYMDIQHNQPMQGYRSSDIMETFINYMADRIINKINQERNESSDKKEIIETPCDNNTEQKTLQFYDKLLEYSAIDPIHDNSLKVISTSDTEEINKLESEMISIIDKISDLYYDHPIVKRYFDSMRVDYNYILSLLKNTSFLVLRKSPVYEYDDGVTCTTYIMSSYIGAGIIKNYYVSIVNNWPFASLMVNTEADLFYILNSIDSVDDFNGRTIENAISCISAFTTLVFNDAEKLYEINMINTLKRYTHNSDLSNTIGKYIPNFIDKIKYLIEIIQKL